MFRLVMSQENTTKDVSYSELVNYIFNHTGSNLRVLVNLKITDTPDVENPFILSMLLWVLDKNSYLRPILGGLS